MLDQAEVKVLKEEIQKLKRDSEKCPAAIKPLIIKDIDLLRKAISSVK
ncbi:hypothetical protein OXB_3413 [Bacillus sp. OxB-1]|nr:hypothetical protein [Bacillus sp. OxB-1]BAQ11882.1 hypothetical protein OXB_3413 [Bacillus sp. OxB-1]